MCCTVMHGSVLYCTTRPLACMMEQVSIWMSSIVMIDLGHGNLVKYCCSLCWCKEAALEAAQPTAEPW